MSGQVYYGVNIWGRYEHKENHAPRAAKYEVFHNSCTAHDKYLRHQDVVDWDVDELHEETNETHDQEPNGSGLGHLHELCMITDGKEGNRDATVKQRNSG